MLLYFIFVDIFLSDLVDESAQEDEPDKVRRGHKAVGEVAHIPDDLNIVSANPCTDKGQSNIYDLVIFYLFQSEEIFETAFTVIIPSDQCRIPEKR